MDKNLRNELEIANLKSYLQFHHSPADIERATHNLVKCEAKRTRFFKNKLPLEIQHRIANEHYRVSFLSL